jgi:phosphate transport system protein
MANQNHINSAFDEGLKDVNKQIAKLGALAETQLDNSLNALKDKNIKKFESIIERDKKLDQITAEISSSVFELLALWSPIAYDLRSLLVADRIGAILERIGDYSKNIARRSQVIVTEEEFDRLPVNIIGLGTHVQELLHQVLDAYMELDVEKAMKIWESDVETDRLYLSIFKETLQAMTEDSDNVKMMTHLIFMSKNLERIGDYTTSIAKQTYFLIEGKVPETKRPKAMTTF